MKLDWVVKISKRDNRCKTGFRVVSISEWKNRDKDCMMREQIEIRKFWPAIEYMIEMDTKD